MEPYKAGHLLSQIDVPADLRAKINETDLPELCDQLRDFIIDVVSQKGGHFGASLGVVELTVALHYVFNTPYDQLVWDVGHQAYGHKILQIESIKVSVVSQKEARVSSIHLA
jgi:1-deoxy-D-xylulose-5-phosphate synthase